MFQITSYAAALQMPGSEDFLEITIAAETEAEAREMIADNFPDEVVVRMLLPIADNFQISI
jgi:hypothetical protein